MGQTINALRLTTARLAAKLRCGTGETISAQSGGTRHTLGRQKEAESHIYLAWMCRFQLDPDPWHKLRYLIMAICAGGCANTARLHHRKSCIPRYRRYPHLSAGIVANLVVLAAFSLDCWQCLAANSIAGLQADGASAIVSPVHSCFGTRLEHRGPS
jgi:hypothetical protein